MNDELSSVTKSITPYEAYQQLYSELVIGVYSDHVTDPSLRMGLQLKKALEQQL